MQTQTTLRAAVIAWYRAYRAACKRGLSTSELAQCRRTLRQKEKDLSAACSRSKPWGKKGAQMREDPTYQVAADIPMPEKRRRHAGFPFRSMQIGHSFASPTWMNKNRRYCPGIRAANYYKRTHPGWDYTSEIRKEDGKIVCRVWRAK